MSSAAAVAGRIRVRPVRHGASNEKTAPADGLTVGWENLQLAASSDSAAAVWPDRLSFSHQFSPQLLSEWRKRWVTVFVFLCSRSRWPGSESFTTPASTRGSAPTPPCWSAATPWVRLSAHPTITLKTGEKHFESLPNNNTVFWKTSKI